MQRKRQEVAARFGQHLITNEHDFPRIPWKPVLVNSKNMGLIEEKSDDDESDNALIDNDTDQRKTTALSVLYASPYVEGNGFYLYTEEALKDSEEGLCNVTIQPEENGVTNINEKSGNETEEDTPVQIVIVSLWYWWKEVIIISLTTAVVFKLMFMAGAISRQ